MRKKKAFLQHFLLIRRLHRWERLFCLVALLSLLFFVLIPIRSVSQTDSLSNASNSHTKNATKHDTATAASNTADSVPPLRVVPNPAFDAGENLTYLIRYGPIVAGNARLSIPEIVQVNGRPCYHIVSEAWSNKFFSTFFKVDDRVESYTDVDGIYSWWFSKQLREGSFKTEHEVTFDQINHLAIMRKGDKSDTLAAPPFVQDVLSAMYFIRTQALSPGDSIFIDNHSDGKLFSLKLLVYKREKTNIRAGKFNCLVVEPFLKTPALFQQKGRVVVYLTDDVRKIPVMMISQLYVKAFKVGTVIAELENIEGVPGY